MDTNNCLQISASKQTNRRPHLRTCYSDDSVRALQTPQHQLYLTEVDIVGRLTLQYAQFLMKISKRVRYLLGCINGGH